MFFACIHVPNFLLQAVIRADESLRNQAVAIFDGIFPLLTVVSLSPTATQKGLYLGMTKTQAELFDVKLLHRSRAQEATAHQALLDCALAISPRVEDTHAPPLKGIGDTVILDIEGLGRLHRSPERLAGKIRRVARQLNLDVNIGIAANPEAAALAAQGLGGVTIISPGTESKCLGPLPVEILKISEELQETFTTWGIQTLQALSSLPDVGLIKRFGQEGKRLQDLARGIHQRILVPIEPELKFEECMELETTLESLEPLTFILARLLRQLCTRLHARSLATNEVRLVLELEVPSTISTAAGLCPIVPPCTRGENRGVFDSLAPRRCEKIDPGAPSRVSPLVKGDSRGFVQGDLQPPPDPLLIKEGSENRIFSQLPIEGGGAESRARGCDHFTDPEPTGQATQEQFLSRHSTVLNLPVPTKDSKTLLKLLQLDLESRPPIAPVLSVYLKTEATSPRTIQRELFEPSGPEPERLEVMLARIAAVVGKNRVGSPVLLNTHKPGSFQLKRFLPSAARKVKRNSPENSPLRGESTEGAEGYLGVTPRDAPRHSEAVKNLVRVPLYECPPGLRGTPGGSSSGTYDHPLASSLPRREAKAEFLHPFSSKGETVMSRSSLRRFRPPIPVRVKTESAVPVVVFFHGEEQKVLECGGPWRINGDWWTNTPWTREEWDVTLSQQSKRKDPSKFLKVIRTQETVVFRIYQDLRTRQWFMEGMYD
jgi:nucleotidyltransferase/DNA polymerase involved in DNA repair